MVPQRPTPGNQALTHSSSFDDGTALTASPEVAAALSALLEHDVTEWSKHGLAEQKRRTVRRVYAGELGGVAVHVKVFRADTIAAKARDALRQRHKGEREARHLQVALDAGLPAVRPLAYGLAKQGEQLCSYVVTQSVAAAPFGFPSDDAAAAAVGALTRQVHDSGLEPGDLHPGNVLLDAHGAAWLCDLTSMRRGGDLSMRRRAAGLAFFCNPLDAGPLDAEARAFLRGYLAAGPMPASFHTELARATRRIRATSLRSFGRRGQRSCRHTDAEPRQRATPRWFWHIGDGGAPKQTRGDLAAFDPSAHTPRRSGRRGGVWLLENWAVKQREAGKAKKLWTAHYWLLFAGVPTPTPVALRLQPGDGLVFARRLHHPDLATELRDGALTDAEVAAAARAVGRAIGRMHGHGLRNRDLKFDNLVRVPDQGEVAMVDLDGVTLHSAADTRGCGRDIGRLLAAWRDAGQPGGSASAARFLFAYVRARRRLLQDPPMSRILSRADKRAREWQRGRSAR
ncbi:MAG: lipopolysaccharide kinase InaA family protein [Planctomycetota bacterium]|nr:lipopolysaccharide kinase InaA family protein [Planctomycetota bacterium]